MTSRELIALAYRHKLIVSAYFVGPLIFAAVVFGDARPVWRATARVHLAADHPAAHEGAMSEVGGRASILTAERAFLMSPDLADAVVAKLGPANLFPGNPSAANPDEAGGRRAAFAHALAIRLDEPAADIALAYQAPSPELARAALSAVISVYLQQRLAPFNAAGGSIGDARAVELTERVNALNQRAAAYRAEQNLIDPDEQRRHLLAQHDTLTDERSRLRNHIAELQGQFEGLKATAPTAGRGDTAADADAAGGARAKLAALQAQFQQISSDQGADSPALKPLQEQMEALRSFLRTHSAGASDDPATDADGVRRQLARSQADLRAEQARLPAVEAQIAEIDQTLRTLQQTALKADQLDRDRDDAARELEAYRERLRAAAANSGMRDVVGVKIVQPPLAETTPCGPDPVAYIGAGLAVSVVGTALSLLALVVGSGRVLVPETLERRYRLPVLATWPGER